MERVFTKDVGRYKAGVVHDYSRQVWRQIAQSAKAALNNFTRSTERLVAEVMASKAKEKRL